MLDYIDEYVGSIKQELALRRDYLDNEPVETIYFGGGTPSLLTAAQTEEIINTIKQYYKLIDTPEITTEGNPSDLTPAYINALHDVGVNRLSIGIQSFNDCHLHFLARRHNSLRAKLAVSDAKKAGFDNISIDLIYGIPTQTTQDLLKDIEQALSLDIQHISTYCLTYEQGTHLTKMVQNGLITPADEDTLNIMADIIQDKLTQAGFRHYEVSNYCKPGRYSHHNCAYWTGRHYLGIGAGAHSYNGNSRQWNTNDLNAYTKGIQAQNLIYEKEVLNAEDKYNEQIMLSLRMAEGINLDLMTDDDKEYCIVKARQYIDKKLLTLDASHLRATKEGLKILDYITCDLLKDTSSC